MSVFAMTALSADEEQENCCPSQCCDSFEVFADFLWWRGDVEGTEVAEKFVRTSTTGTSPFTADLSTIKVEGKWEPGFRFGIGTKLNDYDDWDLSLYWTYFRAKSRHVDQSFDSPEIKPLGISLLGPSALTVEAKWRLMTNLLDLELGKEFYPTCNLSLRPNVGIRGAFFNFRSKDEFLGSWSFHNSAFSPTPANRFTEENPTSQKARFHYYAGGLKFGLDSTWWFNDCFALVGCLDTSFVYGKYKIRQNFEGFQANAINDGLDELLAADLFARKDMWRLRTSLDGFLGFLWQQTFCCDQYTLKLYVGYEMSQWFQLYEVPQLIDTFDDHTAFQANGNPIFSTNYFLFENDEHGDVSFQGLTVEASFEF